MRIDFHVHLTPPEISSGWRRLARREPHFAELCSSPANRFATAEDAAAMLGGEGFDMAAAFGFGFRDPGLCRLANDYVIEKSREFPGRIAGFMCVSPRAKGLEREIARCHDAGLKGVGEIFPEGQGLDLGDSRATRALIGACRERGLPLIVHAGEPVGHSYAGKGKADMRRLERFVEDSRGMSVTLAHWGGGILFYEAMPEVREKFRGVSYDTAATPLLYGECVYRAALALGLGGKIVFGSDFPLLAPGRYMPALEALPPGARGKILGGNAMRILSGAQAAESGPASPGKARGRERLPGAAPA